MFTTLYTLLVLVHLQHFVTCDVRNVTTYHSVTPGEVRTQQPAKFVEKLKKILRRDNEDYIDPRKQVASTSAPASTVSSSSVRPHAEDPLVDQVNDVYRRMMHDRHPRRRHSQRRTDVASHKDRLSERAESQKHHSVKQTNMLDEEGGVPYVSVGEKLFRFRAAAEAAVEADQRRAGADFDDGDADRLDMAPARGDLVDTLRDKGRLCHRHVLIAEGPRYDTRGAVYLRAQSQRAARVFSRTAEPQLLLPRCCDCCKNSVLGCE